MDANLLPKLRAALFPKESYSLQDGFQDGDLLHLLAPVAGRPAGTVWPVLGQNRCCDPAGNCWRLTVYVPMSPADCTTYYGRQATRFPEPGQQERWFAGIPMGFFTEVDVTDWADSMALERYTEAKVIQMYPAKQQAGGLRKAA